jgi:ankyrin repeat protein
LCVLASNQQKKREKETMTPLDAAAAATEERSFVRKLFEAAAGGDFAALKSHVDGYVLSHDDVTAEGLLTQVKDAGKRTALHFACQSVPRGENSGDADIVEELVLSEWLSGDAVNALIRMKDREGMTPLMVASLCGNHPVVGRRVAALLRAAGGGGPKLGLARSRTGATALHYAAGAGASAPVIEALYGAGNVAIGTFSRQSGTPLQWAAGAPAGANFTGTLRALLDCAGVDVNAASAASSSSSEPTAAIPPALHLAVAAENDVHGAFLVRQAAERGIDLTPTLEFILQPGSVSIYHMVADTNLVGTLAALLEYQGNRDADKLSDVIQQKNGEGLTPLQCAAKEGSKGCLLLLLPGENNTEENAVRYMEEWKAIHKEDEKTVGSESATAPPPSLPTNDGSKEGSARDPIEVKAEEQAALVLGSRMGVVTEKQKKEAQHSKATGNRHFADKEWEDAARQYSTAISHDPTDATFYSNRSACYVLLREPEKALRDAVVARHLRPDWPKAAYRVSVARLELGRHEDAAVAAYEGLRMDPDNDELKTLLQTCVEKGRKDFAASKKEETNAKN